jgi:hypothetical protein
MVMRITLRYFDGCPHWETALSRLHEALQAAGVAGKTELALEVVPSQEEAERLRFRGSPTILIDGVDPFAGESAPYGLSCRVYATDSGLQGSPTVAQLRDVLTATS